jgi:hypothetical protein
MSRRRFLATVAMATAGAQSVVVPGRGNLPRGPAYQSVGASPAPPATCRQLHTTHRRHAAWQGRVGRFLGVHLRQLDPHVAPRQGVAPRLRRPGPGRPRSARARVRVRQARGEHRSWDSGSWAHYPIALDNEFETWRAFGNDAWPTKYLFDANGRLVKRWVGEGSYSDVEAEIRRLLVTVNPGRHATAGQPRGDGVRQDWPALVRRHFRRNLPRRGTSRTGHREAGG